jgi:hypothetical protein
MCGLAGFFDTRGKRVRQAMPGDTLAATGIFNPDSRAPLWTILMFDAFLRRLP